MAQYIAPQHRCVGKRRPYSPSRTKRRIGILVFSALLIGGAYLLVRTTRAKTSLVPLAASADSPDDSVWIQNAIDDAAQNRELLQIPRRSKPYKVGPLRIPSHAHLQFESGSVLQAIDGFTDFQRLVSVVDAVDVDIAGYNAVFRMNKPAYKTGEYRHCVYISGSTNVSIRGLTCLEAGGDGFYISGSERKAYSENVTLKDVTAQASKRSGLTVISAKHLIVTDSHFSLSSGAKPETGIDIEPGDHSELLDDVLINNSSTMRNAGAGVRVALSKLNRESSPVTLAIRDHHDTFSGGSGFFGTDELTTNNGARGTVLLERFSSDAANMYGILFSFWNLAGPKAIVTDATITNANRGRATDNNSAIGVIRGGGGVGALGNVEFIGTSILDTAEDPTLDYYFTFVDYSRKGIAQVAFTQPRTLSGAHHKNPLGIFQGQGVDTVGRDDKGYLDRLWRKSLAATADTTTSSDARND